MSRVRIAVAAGLLAAASAVWLWSIRANVAPVPQTRFAVPAPPPQAETRAVETAATVVKKAATTTDYAARFRDADDLLAFIASIRAAAETDGAAQYYLYRAIRRCTREYILYFAHGDRERTLDQALVLAQENSGLDPQTARDLFEQCKNIREQAPSTLTEGPQWLARAAESRYPLAFSAVAREKARELYQTSKSDRLVQAKAEVRELAIEALHSGQAEVIADLAEVVPRFADNPGAADDVNAVWIIAACQRGASCGNESEGFRFLCRMDAACQPYETVIDLLRRAKGTSYDELDARARDLGEKIDQGRFDELGF